MSIGINRRVPGYYVGSVTSNPDVETLNFVLCKSGIVRTRPTAPRLGSRR